MKRDSLYTILRAFKRYKDQKNFCRDHRYKFQGRAMKDIDIAKRKITFEYGITYYYSNDDYHTVFFTLDNEDK